VNLIDRYLTRAVLFPMTLAFAVVGFLVVANELKEQSHRFIVEVLTAWDVVVVGAAFLPSLLPMILPVTLFFGVLMGYGRLAERGEITAMRAAGVSLARLTAPAFVLGLVVTAGTMVLQDRLQPWTMAHVRDFFRIELPRRATLDTLSPGVMHPFGEWRVYFGERESRTHVLRDVTVVRHEEGRGAWVYQAESAEASRDETGPTLFLQRVHLVSPEGIRGTVDSQLLRLSHVVAGIDAPPARNESSLAQLIVAQRELSRRYTGTPSFSLQKELRETRHEIGDRLSMPFAALLLGCIGAPIAAESARFRRAGRRRLLAIGLVPVFFYYLSRVALDPSSLRPMGTVLMLAWAPNFALLALAVGVFVRAARVH
jgi:lipopolysaccharide export LptBFGC system permease protein LptF